MGNLIRRENETKLQFIKRVTENRKDYELDYTEWGALIAGGYLCSSDNARKAFYVVSAMLEEIDEEIINIVTSDDSLEEQFKEKLIELEMAQRELYKERVRKQDVDREIRNRERWIARWEALAEEIVKVVKAQEPITLNYSEVVENGAEGSILLSDWHIGLGIDTPHNKFDLEEAKKRVEIVANETIRYCKMHNIGVLNIDLLGDLTSGLIHTTTRVYQVCDVVKQTSNSANLIVEFIKLVAPHVRKINLHSVTGNHDRVVANYKESLHEENWTGFIEMLVELKTGLTFEKAEVDKEIEVYYLENGRAVALQHGHNFKGKTDKAIADISEYLDMKITYMHMGHFHNPQSSHGVVMNGALCGSDTFANTHRFNDKASQTFVAYYNDGSKCVHEIVLN